MPKKYKMPEYKMPRGNYKSVTLKEELVDRVAKAIRRAGTYHSIAEFISEAVRLRLENIEKQMKAREAEDEPEAQFVEPK
jgi:Arc/MetJ-type ribon-helix-helix transcriptional regulator